MAPRTRRSKIIVAADSSQHIIAENQVQLEASTHKDAANIQRQRQRQTASGTATTTNTHLKGKKRTLAPSDISTPTRSAAQATPNVPSTKRARNAGPRRSRPMPLELVSEEVGLMASGRQSSGSGGMDRSGMDRSVSRRQMAGKFSATSLPPRRERRENDDDPIVSDSEDERISNAASYVETEVDSSIEQDTPELTRTRPSRLQQAVRNERPSWQGLVSTSGPSGLLGSLGLTAPHASGSSGSTGTFGPSGFASPSGSPGSAGNSELSGAAGASSGLSGPSVLVDVVHLNTAVLDAVGISNPSIVVPDVAANPTPPVVANSTPSVAANPMPPVTANVTPPVAANATPPVAANATPPVPTPMLPAPMLPSNDTDLIFVPGTTRLILSAQKPLIRVIVQEAIENLRASLLFGHAFPNAADAVRATQESLFIAAEKYEPGASAIVTRLRMDNEYLALMARLPRPRIPLFRSDVKERCNALVNTGFAALGSPVQIVEAVQKQLMNYNYTFPKAPNANGLVLRARPYRNERIITVTRDLYFSGGSMSFAARFNHRFPTHPGHNGESRNEVPIPMIALVATALYASLYEWRGGEHQSAEFSANSYLDVYDGHVNTFNYIREKHPGAFHAMMGGLYAQASGSTAGNRAVLGVPIAQIDIEALED